MLTTEDAFRAGLALVRGKGFDVHAGHVAVLAAHGVFTRRAEPVEHDARFEAEAPRLACRVILEAMASHAGGYRG